MYNVLFTQLILKLSKQTKLSPVIVQVAILLLMYVGVNLTASPEEMFQVEIINWVFLVGVIVVPLVSWMTMGDSWLRPPDENE